MRRFFTVYFDGNFWFSHKGEAPTDGTAHKYWISMPHKDLFVSLLNEWQKTDDDHLIGTVMRVPADATFPGFDNEGEPVDLPGIVISPGALTLNTVFNQISIVQAMLAFSLSKPEPYQQ